MSDAPIKGGRFQIWLRRRQLQANYPPPFGTFQNVIVQCDPLTGAAIYLPGTVDNASTFNYPSDSVATISIVPVNGWYDFSNWIEGEEKLEFTWDKVNQGDSQAINKDGSNYDKGITSDLVFRDASFRFIYLWLLATECQILNFIEVKIIDLISRGNGGATFDPAGNYRIFEIKSDNLEYAPVDLPCVFNVKLREQDEIWHCIHKTVIWDNWQNWFGGTTTPTTKEFPCFFTCIEPRPRLLSSARLALTLFWESFPLIVYFITKEGLIDHARRVLNANKFVDAPQVYTYILNVAGKCNMAIDTIFNPGQDWENLCLYFPSAGQMKEFNDTGDPLITDLTFLYDNRWLVTLADLLDKLKVVFCAEWYVTPNNTIVFKYIKDLIQLTPIYDYTAVGAEPIYGLKYTFNGDKKPAYGRYEYQDDGSDLASQEMDTLYNDIVDYDANAFNPMLEGDKTKEFEFGCTGFVGDGRSHNYLKLLIKDAEIGALILLVIVFIVATVLIAGITSAAAGFALSALFVTWLAEVLLNRNRLEQEFVKSPKYKGAVRLTCEQVMTPRLLLWDGISMNKAMTDARLGLPVPEPYFNPTGIPYNVANQVSIDNNADDGGFGVYNYPLYFDSMYYGNLYGRFHDMIDNPLKSIQTHQQGKFYVDLCPGQLNLYGVFQNQYAQIGKIVKVETRDGYDVYIRIGNINADYGSDQIVITGNVIRKPASTVDDLNPGNIPVVTPEESIPVQTPTGICYKWRNSGSVPVTVTYNDCNGVLITDQTINPNEEFCALEVLAVDPDTLIVGDACAGSGSVPGSGSPGSGSPGSGSSHCFNFINLSTDTATGVSYIDCEGNLIAGVNVPFMGNFCAREIVNSGACGSIQKTGTCAPCEPCCVPTIQSVVLSRVCVPILTIEFSLPDGAVGEPYEYRQPLTVDGATPPFDIVVTSAPSWMAINVDTGTNELVFSGTPDATGATEVDLTISNCSGNGFIEVGTFIFIGTASADAGTDQSICFSGTATLAGSIGGAADSSQWTTDGDGTFDDDTLLNATYTPGAGDISLGSVTLTLTAFVTGVPEATDTIIITIDPAAIATFDYTVPSASHNYCQCLPSNPSCAGNPISPNFTGGGIAGQFTCSDPNLIFFDGSPSPTGQVDIELTPPGTYTVQNFVDNSCGTDTQTAEIIVLALPVRTFTWSTDNIMTTGEGLVNPVVGGGGGVILNYSSDAGLSINASTGQINCGTSTPGTYDVLIIITSASCTNSATVTVTINP